MKFEIKNYIFPVRLFHLHTIHTHIVLTPMAHHLLFWFCQCFFLSLMLEVVLLLYIRTANHNNCNDCVSTQKTNIRRAEWIIRQLCECGGVMNAG